MDVKAALAALSSITAEAQSLSPILSGLGIPAVGPTIAIVNGALAIANHVEEAIEQAKVVASTSDRAYLKVLTASLQTRAEALNAEIEKS